MHRAIRTILLLVLSATAVRAAQNPPDFFLVPIAPVETHGAFATTWKVFVTYRYDGNRAIVLDGTDRQLQTLLPGTFGGIQVHAVDAPGFPGRFIEAPADQAGGLFIQEHVFEASVPAGGIAVPVVRAGTIPRGRTVHLIGIPTSDSSRTLVRIYDAGLDSLDEDVLVTVSSLDGTTYSDVVHLGSPPVSVAAHFPAVPIYGEFYPRPSTNGILFIDIRPLTNTALKLWAFATTTDNRTQAIVGIFPTE